MRPMTEVPLGFGVEVSLYHVNGHVEKGWVGKIPDGGWDPADRAWAHNKGAYDQYEPGFTHGALPWGSIMRNNKPMSDAYLGWDYEHVIIREDPI